MGKALYEHGEIEAAIQHLEQALQLQPDSLGVLTNLGIAYYAKGDVKKAEEYLLRAYSFSPGNIDINKKLVALYCASGKHEKAIEVYKQLLEIRPDCSSDIYYNLFDLRKSE